MQLCNCPVSAALTSIPKTGCPESFGQIQKVIFQRLKDAEGKANGFSSTLPITNLASWTPLLTASDGTKVVVSPYVQAPTDGGGDAISSGSGNDVLGGIPEIVGTNPITFSAEIRAVSQDVIAAMKSLVCEARGKNLGVYLVSENGGIEAIKGKADGEYHPIPIASLFISDKMHGNLDKYDFNRISWSYLPNYSDSLEIVTPEFNPLTQL